MRNKKWLLTLLIFIISNIIIIETIYQVNNYDRHEVDYLIKKRIPQYKNKEFENILLGDSLARNALGNMVMPSDIVELTSNNAVSMAGNYFILKRYLKNNKKPKKLYLFCIPDHLYQDLNTQHTYSYFEKVFTDKKEIAEIQKIKPSLFKNHFSFNKYIESRLKTLKFLQYYRGKQKEKFTLMIEKPLCEKKDFMNKDIKREINDMQMNKDIIYEIPKIYIDKMNNLCKILNIKFTIVIEPIPEDINKIFKISAIYRYIKNKKIKIININDFYNFNNYFFKNDGTHIHGNTNLYYQNLINKHVIKLES